MVTQDTSLLHRSILDNIRYGRPEASLQEVIAAAPQGACARLHRSASSTPTAAAATKRWLASAA